MFGATLKPGYTCRTIVIFGTLKDGSLKMNILALKAIKQLFRLQERLPKWLQRPQRFVKNGFLNPGLSCLLSKSSKFRVALTIQIMFKFLQHVVQILIKLMYGETLDFQCQH